jgi:hypothetical protein
VSATEWVCLYLCSSFTRPCVEQRRPNLDSEAQLHCDLWAVTPLFDGYSNHVLLFLRSVVSFVEAKAVIPFQHMHKRRRGLRKLPSPPSFLRRGL